MKKYSTYILVLLAVLLIMPEQLFAIPAFARKYRMTCQTCHSPMPRLKEYGDEFAGNGFKLSDQEAPRYYVDTGDEKLNLIREFPFAVRMDAFVTYNKHNDERSDLSVPYNLKLMSGGELYEDIAYYFYFYMSEHGEVAGVEDAYVMFNNLFGSELDVYVGQFQVSDPLFKRELRLTMDDYLVYKMKPGISHADLAYDRGLMLTYGFESGTDVILEIINGNGLNEADGNKIMDNDNYKNVAGRITQDVGEFLRVGVFGYYGKEELYNNVGTKAINDFWLFGPDVTLGYEDIIELNFQYMMRNDGELFRTQGSLIANEDVETKGALAELIFTPNGDKADWYAVALYNYIDSDYEEMKMQTLAGHLGYVLTRNLRIFGEVQYDVEQEFTVLGVGITTAF